MFTIEKHSSHQDHLMRAAQFHLVQLSSMADVKANMLLTMSSVVMTLAMPQLMKNTHLWPLIILVGACMLTICLAAYAVMPKLPSAKGAPPDITSPTFNPLFFGDFTRMSQPDFENTMQSIMSDHNRTYHAQVRELYLLGTYLARKKYRFLSFAYLSFICGLMASFVGFLVIALS